MAIHCFRWRAVSVDGRVAVAVEEERIGASYAKASPLAILACLTWLWWPDGALVNFA